MTVTYIIILISLLIVAIIIVCWLLYVGKVKRLAPQIQDALEQLSTLCNVDRLFTEEEEKTYKQKHSDLYSQCVSFASSKLIPTKKIEDAKLKDFVEAYNDISQRRLHNNDLYECIQQTNKSLDAMYSELFDVKFSDNHYFTDSEREGFLKKCDSLKSALGKLEKNNVLSHVNSYDKATKFYSTVSDIQNQRLEHNRNFRKRQKIAHKKYFDTLLSYPLDEQQREAIVTLEDNCLVISSAGSGKTSTMVGKILYLVEKVGIEPRNILTITYTRKAAGELSERLNNEYLRCMTFHKLALDIISNLSGRKPTIAGDDVLLNVFYHLMKNNIDFLIAVVRYLEDYQSGMKDSFEYEEASDYYADRKKYGIQALYNDMDGNIIFTKSEEEKKICSILTNYGINFRYEAPYEISTYTQDYRQYKPDFSIYYQDQDGREKRIYLEHFGIDRDGNVPKWFGQTVKGGWVDANRKYNDGIIWKKETHRKNHTVLISTTSADFHSGQAEKKIVMALRAHGVPIKKRSAEELYSYIVQRSKSIEKSLFQMCQGFIMLLKANKRSITEVLTKARQNKSERDIYIIENLMRPMYELYETTLSKRGEIDFTDAIIQASEYCRKGLWRRYDYILVDEFQDISIDRYIFLQSLRHNEPLTKLFCVGDDWQSIYRFAGSDMALFVDFSKYFGYTEECKIETTYRFGNPLIERSSAFIQMNPTQRKKSVRPRTINPPKTEIDFVGVDKNTSVYKVLESYVQNIPTDKSIYIIARYTYDSKVLDVGIGSLRNDANRERLIVKICDRDIPFLTVHSSKGLEADYVFLINCNSGIYGFPSMVSDDPVLDYVLSEGDEYEYGEERRVFYVGITRAKIHTYVLFDVDKPSPFVTEMAGVTLKIDQELCPLCKAGYKVALKKGVTKTGGQYIVWACSNHAAGCQYFEREFL